MSLRHHLPPEARQEGKGPVCVQACARVGGNNSGRLWSSVPDALRLPDPKSPTPGQEPPITACQVPAQPLPEEQEGRWPLLIHSMKRPWDVIKCHSPSPQPAGPTPVTVTTAPFLHFTLVPIPHSL